MMSSSIPYSTHNDLGSSRAITESVYSCVRGLAYTSESRFSGNAVHLNVNVNIMNVTRMPYSLGAPSLYDTCEHHLLRVISDEGDKVIYNPPEMSIWTFADDGAYHPRKERAQDCCDGRVV